MFFVVVVCFYNRKVKFYEPPRKVAARREVWKLLHKEALLMFWSELSNLYFSTPYAFSHACMLSHMAQFLLAILHIFNIPIMSV